MFITRKLTPIKVMREQHFHVSGTKQVKLVVAVCGLCSEIKWCQLRITAPNQKGIISLEVISWWVQRNSSKCICAIKITLCLFNKNVLFFNTAVHPKGAPLLCVFCVCHNLHTFLSHASFEVCCRALPVFLRTKAADKCW